MSGFYDLMLLLDPTAPEERRTAAISETESMINSGGELVSSYDWGTRRMAYEIDHRPEAEYRLYQFNGDNTLLERLNQRLRITDAVLRFRIIKVKPGQPTPPPPDQQAPRRRDDREPQDTKVAARAAADAPAVDEALADARRTSPGRRGCGRRGRGTACSRTARRGAARSRLLRPSAPVEDPPPVEAPPADAAARRRRLVAPQARSLRNAFVKDPALFGELPGVARPTPPSAYVLSIDITRRRRSTASWQRPTSTGSCLTGNLTRDPELRNLPSGMAVCSLRIASNTRRKDQSSGEWVDKPNYFDVTVWGAQGENCAQYLSKGRPVAIDGRLEWREWQDKETGKKRQSVDIIADSVQFLGSREGGENGGRFTPQSDVPADTADFTQAPVAAGGSDDDIPF